MSKKLKVLELFGGIGACSKAIEKLGIDFEIADYVEIDKYAVASFNTMHNTNFKPQNICEWDKNIDVDLIMHGSPCQDFSLAGKQAGGDFGSNTRSSLMYETIRIVGKLRPRYVIWENVKNLLSKRHKHNFDAYLETMTQLGYASYYQVLNAKDYGVPQNRERVFVVSIKNDIDEQFMFPQKQKLHLRLKDILEDEVAEKYYLSREMINYVSRAGTANFRNAESKINLDIARPLTTSHDKRAGTTNYISQQLPPNYDLQNCDIGKIITRAPLDRKGWHRKAKEVISDEGICTCIHTQCNNLLQKVETKSKSGEIKIRRLTPKECWRLMGFEDKDFEKAEKINSNTQLYKQAGNSVVVNVLEAILKGLLKGYRV
jgi:DNA (cytosine-5)-methyltransferase 1